MDRVPTPTTCRSCGAWIYFALLENGKNHPVDREPHHWGNILLTYNPARDRIKGKVYAANNVHNIPPGRNRYRSHFSTCPEAEDWRGGVPSHST